MARLPRVQELAFPVAIMGCLLVVLAPLPPEVLDLLLIANIALSVIVLLTTIHVSAPLEFSVFPTLLLATTLSRLVLNVATTRLILTDGANEGNAAAGGVIQSFGQFVAGDQILVGIVIFAIIAVIQFVVITKGATRISEVAARFALDGMPGRQMAIDADLSAGAIDEVEARRRRADVTRQADFYGAMDGASKFVRGDAVAGVFITVINIVGGLVLGIAQFGMSPSEAAAVFTKLTIGDGLASQVPALLISLAAGLLVTRSSDKVNLPVEMVQQLVARPQVLAVAGLFLGMLVLTSLPAFPLMVLGGGCLGAAVVLSRKPIAADKPAPPPKTAARTNKAKLEPRIEEYLATDPVELELGLSLVRLAAARRGGNLLTRITQLRQTIAMQWGLVLPKVRIRDNLKLLEDQYRIKINGNPVAAARLPLEKILVQPAVDSSPRLLAELLRHPAFPQPLAVIGREQLGQAEAAGHLVLDPTTVILQHLKQLVVRHASELLTRDATKHLVDETRRNSPAVVDELIPGVMKLADVQRILQRLLSEGVSIRQLSVILEALGDDAPRTTSDVELTELVRRRLSRSICTQYRDDHERLHVVTLDPALEHRILEGFHAHDRELVITLAHPQIDSICRAIDRELQGLRTQHRPPVLLVRPEIRLAVKRLSTVLLPDLIVISYAEITPETKVVSLGIVSDSEE